MEKIADIELPEPLQEIFAEIHRTKIPRTITHHGEPIAIIYPAPQQSQRPAFGAMQRSGKILADLVEPIVPTADWEVLQ